MFDPRNPRSHHRKAAVLGRADCAELEAIPTEGKGRCAVPVLYVGLDVHGSTAAGGLLLLLRLKEQNTTCWGLYKLCYQCRATSE